MTQPTIITEGAQINFWQGMFPPPVEQLDASLKALGKTASDLFPMTWTSDVPAVGHAGHGTITGFRRWARDNDDGVPVQFPD